MGNIFSMQCGDALSGRCWDCTSKKYQYISKLEDNLSDLEVARDKLTEKRSDVMRHVINQQRPQMEPTDQVKGWVSQVDLTISQVSELLARGPQERQHLCMAGHCSKHCLSTYNFGKSVAQSVLRVNALMAEAGFEQVVVNMPAKKLESNLQQLKDAKIDLLARKYDVQRRISSEEGPGKRILEEVKVWLSKAETLVAEAGQLLEDGSLELNKLLGGDNSNFVFVGRVSLLIDDICSLHSQGYFSQVTAKSGPQRVVGRNQRPTVGSEEMLEEAWRLLQKDEVGIIGIYGMGGVGKTTLLTHINNKFVSISDDFDVVMWVVVSKDLKLENIQISIWKQVQSLDERWLQKNIQEKAQDIFNVLQGKKFVLLIDDVWQQFDLDEIGVPLPTKRNGCKVVFTTRSFVVCKQMEAKETLKVKPLNWKEAWKLFKGKVGKIDSDILHVAQKVAEECRGLPIALITIGRSMASKSTVEEWQYALTVLRRSISNLQGWEDELYQGMEVHVFRRLKFSYDSLSNDKQRSCFVYCCLFPEDFKIFKDDLIHYWVAEKFCVRGEGYGIIYTLIHRCLLEEDGDYVKLHDVVRDMAIWIACETEKENYKFFTQAGSHLKKLPEATKWEGAKRVSFMANSLESIEGSPRCCDLVTLFLSHNKELERISQGFFKFETRGLTVLDLSHTKIDELPLEIMELQSLEYLNLSYTWLMELPAEMAALTRLKYLHIAHNFLLEIIPVNVISDLSELRVLNMYRCGSPPFGKEENGVFAGDGDNLMEELMCLNDLCELSLTVWSACSLPDRSKLQILNSIRALYLCQFVNTKSSDISNLAYATQLHRLDICSTDHLEELCIEEMEPQYIYPGSSPSNSLLNFAGLREVNVEKNKSLRHLTWLIFVPHLLVLRAHTNKNMDEVISEEKLIEHQAVGEHLSFFEKLQVLDFGELPKLKAICPVALPFPCLTEINIRSCQALEKLPLNLKSAEGCNIVIKGEESWWKKLTWEDDQTRSAFLPIFRSI